MKTASWILLTIVGALTLVGALASVGVAYGTAEDRIGPLTLTELAAGRGEVATAVKARRGTAAAYAAAYAVLVLCVVLGPYRRGDAWAWWALLAASLVLAALVLARIPLLGVQLGAATGGIQLVVVVLALLLDVGRVRGGAR